MRRIHGLYPFRPPVSPPSDPRLAGIPTAVDSPIYLPAGPFAEFHGLVQRHYIAMEHSASDDGPDRVAAPDAYALGDVELFD